jgi:hypothetical protein
MVITVEFETKVLWVLTAYFFFWVWVCIMR